MAHERPRFTDPVALPEPGDDSDRGKVAGTGERPER